VYSGGHAGRDRRVVVRNYLSPLAEPREIPHKGFGSFAIAPINTGTVVATFGGTFMSRSVFNNYPAEQQSRSLQIEANNFALGPEAREPGDSINHSCSPNCGMRNATQVVSMRPIAVGEELTFDYSMSDASDYDEFDCACGAPNCRKRITGEDWKLSELQLRYQGMFSPYIQRMMDASRVARLLTKREVETLMNNYDAHPQKALASALRIAIGMPHASWQSLIDSIETDDHQHALLSGLDQQSLDQLAQRLNEFRAL
jgi:hypothetical protein